MNGPSGAGVAAGRMTNLLMPAATYASMSRRALAPVRGHERGRVGIRPPLADRLDEVSGHAISRHREAKPEVVGLHFAAGLDRRLPEWPAVPRRPPPE